MSAVADEVEAKPWDAAEWQKFLAVPKGCDRRVIWKFGITFPAGYDNATAQKDVDDLAVKAKRKFALSGWNAEVMRTVSGKKVFEVRAKYGVETGEHMALLLAGYKQPKGFAMYDPTRYVYSR